MVAPAGLPAFFYLGLLGYLGSFSRLISDDYCSVYIGRNLGFLRSIWFWYSNWNGRYTNSIFDWVLSAFPGLVSIAVPLTLVAWLGVTIWAVYLFIPESSGQWVRVWSAFSLACVMISVVLLASPNISQSLFWWGGLRAYTQSLVVFTFEIALYRLVRLRGWGQKRNLLLLLSMAGLSFLTAGFSETLTPVLVIFWFLLAFIEGWRSREKTVGSFSRASIATALGALAGLLVMVFAPGNTFRQALSPSSPGLVEILSLSLRGYQSFLAGLFSSWTTWLSLCGVFLLSAWFGLKLQVKALPARSALWFILGGLLFGFGFFPPAAYGLMGFPPTRALILVDFSLVVSFSAASFILGSNFSASRGFDRKISQGLYTAAILLLLAGISANILKVSAYEPLLSSYAGEWDSTQEQILAARSARQPGITIHSVRNWAGLNDPGDNPRFWVNSCMSKYYGINILTDNTGMQPGNLIK